MSLRKFRSHLLDAIVAPTADVDVDAKLREALQKPDIFQKVFGRFDKKPIPREEIFKNTLQTDFGVPKGDVQACYDVIMANVNELKLADDIKGTKWLRLDLLSSMLIPPLEPSPEGSLEEHEETAPGEPTIRPALEKLIQKKIFVAHGKNKKPLEQLKGILTQFKVLFEVAVDLPHIGRPIATKVLETMQECTSGIFIFTADEQTTDSEGRTVMRPSDNVVFELGAGIALFGDKIVIFREDGVTFGSDFTDYGHITLTRTSSTQKHSIC